MSQGPVIYISAVSTELRRVREAVAKSLLKLDCKPTWQDFTGLEDAEILENLRRKIDDSQGLIQVVGQCYGAESATPDASFGRISHTQYEILYAQQKGKPVWVLMVNDHYLTEAEEPESEDFQLLQRTYREYLRAGDHVRETIYRRADIDLIILKLSREIVPLRRRGKGEVLLVGCLLLALIVGIVWGKPSKPMTEPASPASVEVEPSPIQAAAPVVSLAERHLNALREWPHALAMSAQSAWPETDAARSARAYRALEEQFQLAPASLEKELPLFAGAFLLRSDCSALDRALALLMIQKFAEAETLAMEVKEQALIAPGGKAEANAVRALEIAALSAEAQIFFTRAVEHYRAADALTSPERDLFEWAYVQIGLGWLYHRQERESEQVTLMEELWKAGQKAGKEDHPMMKHARELFEGGQRRLRQLAAEQIKKDPRMLEKRSLLASDLRIHGRYEEAEKEQRAVLALCQGLKQADDPDVLNCRVSLGYTLSAAGKLQEAEDEYRQVLPIMVRVLGAEHIDVLNCRNNLAEAIQAQGRWAEMEPEHRAVMALREKTLGAQHPHVFESCYNLAICLEQLNMLPEALQMAQRSENGRAKALGVDDPDTKKASTLRQRLEAAMAKEPQ